MSLSTSPKLYNHAELNQPAKPINQKPVQAAPVNPYQTALRECGEALI
jgi:hypothetical protein